MMHSRIVNSHFLHSSLFTSCTTSHIKKYSIPTNRSISFQKWCPDPTSKELNSSYGFRIASKKTSLFFTPSQHRIRYCSKTEEKTTESDYSPEKPTPEFLAEKKRVDALFHAIPFARSYATTFAPGGPSEWDVPGNPSRAYIPHEVFNERWEESYNPSVHDELKFDLDPTFVNFKIKPRKFRGREGDESIINLPRDRFRKVDARGGGHGYGGRKSAHAHAYIVPGTGIIRLNGRELVEYFPNWIQRETVLEPFLATETFGLYDAKITAYGGGYNGQAGAIRLAVSKAFEKIDPEWRSVLKSSGYMKRDERIVERKKPGRKKARKRFQWNKR